MAETLRSEIVDVLHCLRLELYTKVRRFCLMSTSGLTGAGCVSSPTVVSPFEPVRLLCKVRRVLPRWRSLGQDATSLIDVKSESKTAFMPSSLIITCVLVQK